MLRQRLQWDSTQPYVVIGVQEVMMSPLTRVREIQRTAGARVVLASPREEGTAIRYIPEKQETCAPNVYGGPVPSLARVAEAISVREGPAGFWTGCVLRMLCRFNVTRLVYRSIGFRSFLSSILSAVVDTRTGVGKVALEAANLTSELVFQHPLQTLSLVITTHSFGQLPDFFLKRHYQGFLSWYHGFGMQIATLVAGRMAYYGALAMMGGISRPESSSGTSQVSLHLSNFALHLSVAAVSFPLGTITRGMQLRPDLTFKQLCQLIYSNGGLLGFYRGFGAFLVEAYCRWLLGVIVAAKMRSLRDS